MGVEPHVGFYLLAGIAFFYGQSIVIVLFLMLLLLLILHAARSIMEYGWPIFNK